VFESRHLVLVDDRPCAGLSLDVPRSSRTEWNCCTNQPTSLGVLTPTEEAIPDGNALDRRVKKRYQRHQREPRVTTASAPLGSPSNRDEKNGLPAM
jgi:hypothetical protein